MYTLSMYHAQAKYKCIQTLNSFTIMEHFQVFVQI